jgi:uncharacterized protein
VADLKIAEMIRQAAERGDPFAQFEMGHALEWGIGGEQNLRKASGWYSKAASQGHQAAEGNFLLQHVFGQVAVRHPDAVFAELKKRAEAGDHAAENNLGLCFQFGYGTPQDYLEAAIWFRRAARAGSATAQFNLGGLYYNGNGLPKDLRLAVEWYTRAAEQRDELALIQLGKMNQKGEGTQLDLDRAVVLYLIAYRLGSARAANHLAFMFKKGLGVRRDDALAYALYLESVNEPDTPAVKEEISYHGTAYYWLGYMAEHGEGVEPDVQLARRWYRRGAACKQSNCVEALTRLRS